MNHDKSCSKRILQLVIEQLQKEIFLNNEKSNSRMYCVLESEGCKKETICVLKRTRYLY